MATENNTASSSMATVIFSSTIGTAIEWYDFFLYGTMATLVFPKVFFPETNALVGTILSLFTFLVGFIARPFGGALFGHFGDRIGRKSTLIATLLLMGLSTLIIGFLPGYATLGIVAPLILVLLRLGQGLGVGGEWGGSVLLAMEYGYRRNRGFWASWPQMGVPVGLVLSTVIVNIVQASTGANFLAWGWRIPFFVSAVLVLIGLYIRLRILETPLFAAVKNQGRESSAPILEAFRHSTPEILLSAGARFVEQAPFYLFSTFVITYGVDKLLLSRTLVLNAITIAAIVELFTIPLFGYLSDRVGRRIWYLIGCVLMAAFAFPYFLLMNTKASGVFILAVASSLAFFHAWVYGPQAALIAERFDPLALQRRVARLSACSPICRWPGPHYRHHPAERQEQPVSPGIEWGRDQHRRRLVAVRVDLHYHTCANLVRLGPWPEGADARRHLQHRSVQDRRKPGYPGTRRLNALQNNVGNSSRGRCMSSPSCRNLFVLTGLI